MWVCRNDTTMMQRGIEEFSHLFVVPDDVDSCGACGR